MLAAPDKFRGTATAGEVAAAIARAAATRGRDCVTMPMSDGGEGLLEAFGGANRLNSVTGPHGDPVRAEWRLDDGLAVVESSQANGLLVAGGADRNDPVAATSAGVGELVAAALDSGARRVVVGLGGSATTDGGLPAVRALARFGRLDGSDGAPLVEVCCDVRTGFLDAARVFGPQKGASPRVVDELTDRLALLAERYREEFDLDVTSIPGSGAAGGLGGGLAVLGARLVPGFATVAAHVGLDRAVRECELVVTGEGTVDESSFAGKVVGGVVDLAATHGKPVLVVAGRTEVERPYVISLTERFGPDRSRADTVACVEDVVAEYLR